MRKISSLEWISLILLIIGGLNWGLIGLFNFNLVTMIFGETIIGRLIYVLVGLAAIYEIVILLWPARENR